MKDDTPRAIAAALPNEQQQQLSRWTPQAVIGLLCLVAATILRRVLDDAMGRDVGDGLMMLGGALIGWAPALPPIKPPGGGSGPGSPGTGIIVGLALGAAAMLAPGCGAAQVRADESVVWQRRPGPDCYVRLLVDGEEAITVEAPFACSPPPEFCAAPEVTP